MITGLTKVSEFNRLPNLICPGAPKAGTTTLYSIFLTHPDVFVSDYKELYYFGNDRIYDKGLNWYQRNFSGYNGQKYIADITPFYLASPKAPGRIREQLGENVKFILMLRNPSERAYSQYLMQKREGRETRTFEEAIAAENKNNGKGSLLNNGLYHQNLSRFLEHYPQENFHLVFTEDLEDDFRTAVSGIFEFLGLDAPDAEGQINSNSRFQPKRKILFRIIKKLPNRYKVMLKKLFGIRSNGNLMRRLVGDAGVEKIPMNAKTYSWLQDFYENDINSLMELTGKDLSCWLKK